MFINAWFISSFFFLEKGGDEPRSVLSVSIGLDSVPSASDRRRLKPSKQSKWVNPQTAVSR